MPLITLTRDISPKKGWTKGKVMDWARPTITQLCRTIGDKNWYEFAEDVDARTRSAAVGKRRREV